MRNFNILMLLCLFSVSAVFAQKDKAQTTEQEADTVKKNWKFDVEWDFLISYNFLKVLNVTFSTNMKFYNGTLISDQNGVAKDRVQFKSVLGIGLGYSF